MEKWRHLAAKVTNYPMKPYRSPDWALVHAKTGPKAEYYYY
jgi:hypothetical protein